MSTAMVSVRVSTELKEKIEAAAQAQGQAVSEFLKTIIEDRLNGVGSGASAMKEETKNTESEHEDETNYEI